MRFARQAAGFDLDSTIANTHHRHHTVNGIENPDWEAYSMLCSDDEPIMATVTLMHVFRRNGWDIVIISGRDECAFDLTYEWLRKHMIPFDHFILRAPGRSGEHNHSIKVEQVQRLRQEGTYDIQYFVDDWPPVKPAMEEIGIPTLIVQPPQCECYTNKTDVSTMETLISQGSKQL